MTAEPVDPRFLGGETAVLTNAADMAFVVCVDWNGAVDMTANIDKPQMATLLRRIADTLDLDGAA